MGKINQLLDYTDGFAEHKDISSILIKDTVPSFYPLVSIMIPTYKRPALLFDSVRSALSQTTSVSFEVVVVDNDADSASETEVNKVIASFKASNLRLYRNQANIGMFGNWNRCIELARGSWLTILNDDDLLDKNFLLNIEKILCSQPSAKMIACSVLVRDERNSGIGTQSKAREYGSAINKVAQIAFPQLTQLTTCDYFLGNPHFGSLGILLHRESALQVGGLNSHAYPSADFAFLIRFQSLYPSFLTKKKLAIYRINQNESLKAEVVEMFVAQSYQIRAEIASNLPIPQFVCDIYSRWLAIEIENSYYYMFGVTLNKANDQKKNTNSPQSVYWRIRFLKFSLKLWCIIFSWFSMPSSK